ncbi:MAG: O-methyltransferase [Candidatus Methylomirabilia bacterium]
MSGRPRGAIARAVNAARNAARICRAVRRSGTGRAVWLLGYVEDVLGGHESSVRRLPVDALGCPLPWYTYPAIEYLAQLDFSGCSVFEYGSGNGSKYWSRRARTVVSVEADPRWHETGARELAANQRLLLKEDKVGYVGALHSAGGDFDIIVIDGAYRYDCATEAPKRLRDGGLIVLDNSDWFPNTARVLRQDGFTQVDFAGVGPINAYAWCTSMYFKRHLSVPRKDDQSAVRVLGGLVQQAEQDRPVS